MQERYTVIGIDKNSSNFIYTWGFKLITAWLTSQVILDS